MEGRNISVPAVKEISGTNKGGDISGSYWGRCIDAERGQTVKGGIRMHMTWGKTRSAENIGSKRKSEEVEHPYAKSKGRGSVAHAFLFGTSQVRPMTTELGVGGYGTHKRVGSPYEERWVIGSYYGDDREADQMREVK